MKNAIKKFDYISVLKYALLTALYLLFSSIGNEVSPYSTSILTASLYLGNSFFFSCFFYVISFLILGKNELFLSSLITCFFFAIVKILHKRERFNSKFNYVVFCLLSLIGFILTDTPSFDRNSKIIIVLLTTLLSYFTINASSAITKKGLKFNPH